jgi:hypothetical protein
MKTHSLFRNATFCFLELNKYLLISIEADWKIKTDDFQENLDDNESIRSTVCKLKFEFLL